MPGPTHPSAVSGVFGSPFAEQVAFFRQKLGNLVPTERWDDLLAAEHDRAFMVAGATKAELLSDLAAAVDKAIAEGRGIEDFRKDFREIVARNGWTGWTGEGSVKGEAWRVRTIYRTNSYTSYAAGRYAQLKEGNFKYWVYRHGGSMEPRPQHLSWDGVALPPDHPFWTTHYPPSDWGCSCYVVGTNTAAGVRRLGGDPAKKLPANWQAIDPKTGAPVGIGKGWNYAPGASVASTVSALAQRISLWPAQVGAAFGGALPESARAALADDFQSFVEQALSGPPAGKTTVIGALDPAWVSGAAKRGVSPTSAEIVVRDHDVWHTFRDSKASPVSKDWYASLPVRLGESRAVLLDRTRPDQPVYLLIFDLAENEQAKAIVRINFKVKKMAGERNVLVSARRVTLNDLRAQMQSAPIDLIEGEL